MQVTIKTVSRNGKTTSKGAPYWGVQLTDKGDEWFNFVGYQPSAGQTYDVSGNGKWLNATGTPAPMAAPPVQAPAAPAPQAAPVDKRVKWDDYARAVRSAMCLAEISATDEPRVIAAKITLVVSAAIAVADGKVSPPEDKNPWDDGYQPAMDDDVPL